MFNNITSPGSGFGIPGTVTGVTLTTVSSYAASGTVNGAPNTVTLTTSGVHGLAAMLSFCMNVAASGGTNSGALWAGYNWSQGTPGSSTLSLPNPGGILQAPIYPWLGVAIGSDATVAIIQGSWLVTSVPSTTTLTINMTAAQYALFTGTLAGTPTIAPFIVLGPGGYHIQLGANTTVNRGVTTNAAGTALAKGVWVPGSVDALVTGAAVSGSTPGSIVPFYNGGVPLGGTVTSLVAMTGNATTTGGFVWTDGAMWQISPAGAGTTTVYKY